MGRGHNRRYRRRGVTTALPLLLFITLLIWGKRSCAIAQVRGRSMVPTLQQGDYILGVRVPHRPTRLRSVLKDLLLQREAVVLVRPPAHLSRLEVKRIAGIANDIRDWGWGASAAGSHVIPPDHVYLVSDASRFMYALPGPSADSRLYGPCPSTAVLARVVIRYRSITDVRLVWNEPTPFLTVPFLRTGMTPAR